METPQTIYDVIVETLHELTETPRKSVILIPVCDKGHFSSTVIRTGHVPHCRTCNGSINQYMTCTGWRINAPVLA